MYSTTSSVSRSYLTRSKFDKRLIIFIVALTHLFAASDEADGQIVDITVFASIDVVDDDPSFSGLQSGDEVIIDWLNVDLGLPADFPDVDFAEVSNPASDVQVSTFSGGFPGPDFFLDDFNSILMSNVFAEIMLSGGGTGYFGDQIDFYAGGPESSLDFYFFNFSFDVPFSGPGGTDPSIPDDIGTDPTPLQYVPLIDTMLLNPIGNGQGSFSSDEVSFSFFVDQVQFDGTTGGDLLADLNDDDFVDDLDFDIWQNNYATGNPAGDVNSDGFVDGTDYLIWQRQFGASNFPTLSAVPEPTTPTIAFVIAIVSVGICRNQQTSQTV